MAIAAYFGDMKALESQFEEALDRQPGKVADDPAALGDDTVASLAEHHFQAHADNTTRIDEKMLEVVLREY